MAQLTYYTVIIGKRACIVTYAQSPAYETKLFSGAFADAGEASQEFKKSRQDQPEYLTPGVFDRKINHLANLYQSDLMKLADWNQRSQVTHGRTSRMALITNAQYFNNLPQSGLELAEEYLEQDLETLQENDLPVSDTVAGLLTVHTLQAEAGNETVSEGEISI